MSEKKTYTVHRAMHGDGRDYARGDTREMTAAEAATLVKSGALSLEGEEPTVREPGVRHTFGTVESKVNREGYTSAIGEPVTVPSPAPTKAKTKPATTGAA